MLDRANPLPETCHPTSPHTHEYSFAYSPDATSRPRNSVQAVLNTLPTTSVNFSQASVSTSNCFLPAAVNT